MFLLEWYNKFGFSENPFEINPFNGDFEILGLEKEKDDVIYRVSAGNMVLITGDEGSGKSSLLKHIVNNFRGKGKVIYVNGDKLNKALDIEKLLMRKRGLKRKLSKKKPHGMILLLDNVNSISRKNCEKIKYYYDNDHLRSVVFTATDASSVKWDASIMDRVDKRIIKLKMPLKKKFGELISTRLGDIEVFENEDTITAIADLSSSPKEALINADKVAKSIADKENGDDLNKEKIKKIIAKKEEEEKEEDETLKCARCGGDLKNIKDNWRCENCDAYCTSCGALIEDEDEECPECGAEFQ